MNLQPNTFQVVLHNKGGVVCPLQAKPVPVEEKMEIFPFIKDIRQI